VPEAVCDASVVLKWFRTEGEDELEATHELLEAHVAGRVQLRILDLTFYELGNILGRSSHLSAAEVAEVLDQLEAICGSGLALRPRVRLLAAEEMKRHGLTFYDAAYLAAADERGTSLVSADAELIRAGAESPRRYARGLAD
jgi:predicted nucleic acid-binding protein